MELFRQSYGDGPPLVIVHGLLGAGGNWTSLARNFFGKHFRTIVVDLRNHGRSPHDDTFDYPSMSQDLVKLFDDEGISDAHLIGHSMGGKLGMHLALEHGDRIDRLVVADIAPRAYHSRHGSIFRALDSIDPAMFESRSEIELAMQAMIPEKSMRQFLLKNLSRDEGAFQWKINLSAIRDGYSNIITEVESWNTFEGDVLFIRGEESDYLDKSDEPSIRALFPFYEMKSIPKAGHWLHADNPELFASFVIEFLAGK